MNPITLLPLAVTVYAIALLLLLYHLHRKVVQAMALGQDILDKVTIVDTKVGSFIALIQALINDNTIPPDVGAAIFAKLQGTDAALEAAIAANTPPTP